MQKMPCISRQCKGLIGSIREKTLAGTPEISYVSLYTKENPMKKWLGFGLLIFILCAVVLVVYSLRSVSVGTPIADSQQIVLVVARTDQSQTATLQAFTRTPDGGWEFEMSTPAVIGERGLGWGIGLHHTSARLHGQPEKREGDGKAPEGVFPLLHAYGYQPPSNVNIAFPYTQSTEALICVDDPGSK